MKTNRLVFACHSKACAPPPAGRGGSDKGGAGGGAGGGPSASPGGFKPGRFGTDPILDQWRKSRERTVPGRGASLKDDGIPGSQKIKIKSIPNIPTKRLERRSEHLTSMINTHKGLTAYTDTRRSLVHHGVTLLSINHELRLRGKFSS